MKIALINKQPQICFLTFLNRTGSTLLASKLSQFEKIGVGIEAKLIDGIQRGKVDIKNESDLDNYLRETYNDYKFQKWSIPKETIKNELLKKYQFPIKFEYFLNTALDLYFSNSEKEIYIHKNGRYFSHVQKLKRMFPIAKFIFIDRDPRAIYNSLSKSRNSIDNSIMLDDIESFVNLYRKTQVIVNYYDSKDYFLKIYYEDLIANPNDVINKILDFLDIKDRKILSNNEYFDRIPDEQKHLHKNLKDNSIKKDRIYSWRNELESDDIEYIEQHLSYEIMKNNYEIININRKRYSLINNLKRLQILIKLKVKLLLEKGKLL